MKPEVKAILDSIGFENAKAYSKSLFDFVGIDRSGGVAFSSKREAKEARAAIEALARAIDKLPPHVRELWDHHSRRSIDWDEDRSILQDVIYGLAEIEGLAEHAIEDPWGSFTGSRDRRADAIAYRMAEIYVLGLGEIPHGKARSTDGSPNGRYTRAVQDMFEALGLNKVSFRVPCERAVNKLVDSGQADALLRQRRNGRW